MHQGFMHLNLRYWRAMLCLVATALLPVMLQVFAGDPHVRLSGTHLPYSVSHYFFPSFTAG
jgi:hypothetical protein